jgi:hypothetical protein
MPRFLCAELQYIGCGSYTGESRMRATQWIAAGLLALTSSLASAVPVTMGSQSWEWKWDQAVNAGTAGSTLIDDRYVNWDVAQFDSPKYSVASQYGTAEASAFASMQFQQSGSADAFSFNAIVDMAVSAAASSGLPTNGYAVAGMRLNRAIFYFDVAEEVLYTGAQSLYDAATSHPFFLNGPTYASGTILAPGRYFTSFLGESLWAWANPGDTLNLSAHTNYDYDFVRVPVPATLSLLLIGLGGFALTRFRAAGRSR